MTQITLTDHQKKVLLTLLKTLFNGGDEKGRNTWYYFALKVNKQVFHINADEKKLLTNLMQAMIDSGDRILSSTDNIEVRIKTQVLQKTYIEVKEQLNGKGHDVASEIDNSKEGLQGSGRSEDLPGSGAVGGPSEGSTEGG